MPLDHPVVVVLLTVVTMAILKVVVVLILGGGSLGRVGLATKAYFRTMKDAAFAQKVQLLLGPAEAPRPVKRSAEPLRLLTLLQREGRLLDFLLEDIQSATDDQVGAGVRELHKKAQAVLRDHLVLEPVLARNEGEAVEVPAGFDPSAIRVTGNVTGSPPFKGTLRHPGWRVKDFKLAAPPEGQDEFVVAPAEVEVA